MTPAPLRDRFLARLVDGVLLGVTTTVVVNVVVVGAVLGHAMSFYGTGSRWVDVAVSAVLTAAIDLGYFAFMESTEGRTVGKRVMGLRTLGPDGGRPTLEEAVRRNIWTPFGILGVVPVVGSTLGGLATLAAVIAIAVGINADAVTRQGWHDRFAGGTRVVR